MSALRQQLQVFADKALSEDARSALLAKVARQTLADLQASGRASPRYRVFVDGREGASEDEVSGRNGVILYDFNYTSDAAAFALGYLQARAPSASGTFRDSFMVAIDGRPVPAASFRPDSVPPAAEVMIYNPEPYTRKIDVQLVGNRVLHYSVPPGMFSDAARATRARFGNAVKVKRTYNINFPGKWVLRRGEKRGDYAHSPALVISPLG